MILVKSVGGLGNQMFQYAAARGVSSEIIFFDCSSFRLNCMATDLFTPRTFELDVFTRIRGKRLSTFTENVFDSDKLANRILRNILYGKTHLIKQQSVNELIKISNCGNSILQGFFQSEKYFNSKREELLHEFEFPELDELNIKLIDRIQSIESAVSIHIRRGDYTKEKVKEYHGILPLAYYKKSIATIENEVKKPFYFIFSDDTAWCEQNLSYLSNFEIVKGNNGSDAWKDMCLMSHCRHHIIANSSFSWWGAWLSRLEGIKQAPFKWFNPAVVSFNINDIVPQSWRVVYYE